MLKEKGMDSPRLDAEVLLAHCLGMERVGLYVNSYKDLNPEAGQRYFSLVERRGRGEPVAYITGVKEFMGLDFTVTPDVLIPRPETELLVEAALAAIATRGRFSVSHFSGSRGELFPSRTSFANCDREPSPCRIVDVGTGSGAIAVSLAGRLPGAKVYALDISLEALSVARVNAQRHGVADRIVFLCGDLLGPLPGEIRGAVDLIAANLPYVPSGEIPGLMPDVGLYEPHTALDGGHDGLDFYRRLIPMAESFLRPGGTLLMEIAPGQGEKLTQTVLPGDGSACGNGGKGPWELSPCRTRQAGILLDLAGRERLVAASFG
ncbi:hypothetical protein DCCM_4783 [Desulfocucumis palustris]|uniref:Release factor glutamine methyltransferase n=1 Tax=Desulfocucumis palustris TaxID=1898651 RepID=A0A2L2XI51_9FIRM|nr:hypothetical protein DCCM_4783 [Desulfocucumis palustris]